MPDTLIDLKAFVCSFQSIPSFSDDVSGTNRTQVHVFILYFSEEIFLFFYFFYSCLFTLVSLSAAELSDAFKSINKISFVFKTLCHHMYIFLLSMVFTKCGYWFSGVLGKYGDCIHAHPAVLFLYGFMQN